MTTGCTLDLNSKRWCSSSTPEKFLAAVEPPDDDVVARILRIDTPTLRSVRRRFAQRVRTAADQLITNAAFASAVDAFTLARRGTLIALGDSTTDDLQSWAEITRRVLELRRPQDFLEVVNAGRSADVSTQVVSRPRRSWPTNRLTSSACWC